MNKLFRTLICFASIILAAPTVSAQFEAPPSGLNYGTDSSSSTSSVIASVKSITSNQKFEVALKLNHPKSWHSYYHNDGIGVSTPPSIEWVLPEGFKASSLIYPTPHKMMSFGLNTYGYDGTNYFITEITASSDIKVGDTFQITAKANWQICKVSCVQESDSHTLQINTASSSVSNPIYETELSSYKNKYIPALVQPSDWTITANEENNQITVKISSESNTTLPDDIQFFEHDGQLDIQQPVTITRDNGTLTISGVFNQGNDFSSSPTEKLDHIQGILYSPSTPLTEDRHSVSIRAAWTTSPALLTGIDTTTLVTDHSGESETNEDSAKDIAIKYDLDSKISIITLDRLDDDGNAIDDAGNIIDKEDLFTDGDGNITDADGNIIGKIKKTTFFWAALLIFGGGLILNLMPCVFPVLGVKVLGFVQLAGNDPKKIKMHGIVFTLGVIASMWILAAVILILRETSGDAVAWGSQMKDPYFVGIMIILLTLFSLNLYGVFEVGTSLTSAGGNLHTKKGYEGSFFSGILTTLIATPCGAPLLATAMTYTLQQTVFLAMVLFTVFALGVAAPYLVLSFFPALINKLPRPGAWMVTFKKSMAFPLLATVVFLLTVFIAQTGQEGITLMLWSLIILATAAFIYGTWSPPFTSKIKRYTIGFGLSIILATAGGYLGHQAMSQAPDEKQEVVANPDDIHSWENWKPGLVDQTRAKKRIVWIDYTADW